MTGTVVAVNKAINRPLLIFGVEKNFFMVNILLNFPLLAASRMHFPACMISLILFSVLHIIFRIIANYEPQLSNFIKRGIKFWFTEYYPSHSHPLLIEVPVIKTVSHSSW